jgi:hypothetical protein
MADPKELLSGQFAKVVSGQNLGMQKLGLSDETLIQLCGAPKNSELKVFWKISWTAEERDGEDLPEGLFVQIFQSGVIATCNEVIIYRNKNDDALEIYLKLVDFKVDASLKGIGGWLIDKVSRHAMEHKVRTLQLLAAGGRTWASRLDGSRWRGWVVWPRYGFEMELADSEEKVRRWQISEHFSHVPKDLASCKTVQMLLSVEHGKEFWHLCGDGDYMVFNLTPNSASFRALGGWRSEQLMRERKDVMTNMKTNKDRLKLGRNIRFQSSVGSTVADVATVGPQPTLDEELAVLARVKRTASATDMNRMCSSSARKGAELPSELED